MNYMTDVGKSADGRDLVSVRWEGISHPAGLLEAVFEVIVAMDPLFGGPHTALYLRSLTRVDTREPVPLESLDSEERDEVIGAAGSRALRAFGNG